MPGDWRVFNTAFDPRGHRYAENNWLQDIWGHLCNAKCLMQESSLQYIAWELDRMATAMELDEQIPVFALQIIRNADRTGMEIDSLDLLTAGSFYAACRVREAPVTIRDIASVSRKPQKEIRTKAKTIADTLGLQFSLGDPIDIVRRDGQSLGLRSEQMDRIIELAERAVESDFHINKPHSSVSAAVLYAGSVLEGWQYGQSDVSEVVGVSTVTIRSHYKEAFKVIFVREEAFNSVKSICNKIDFSKEKTKRVLEVAQQALNHNHHLYDSYAQFCAGAIAATADIYDWRYSRSKAGDAVGVNKGIVFSRAEQMRDDIDVSTLPDPRKLTKNSVDQDGEHLRRVNPPNPLPDDTLAVIKRIATEFDDHNKAVMHHATEVARDYVESRINIASEETIGAAAYLIAADEAGEKISAEQVSKVIDKIAPAIQNKRRRIEGRSRLDLRGEDK